MRVSAERSEIFEAQVRVAQDTPEYLWVENLRTVNRHRHALADGVLVDCVAAALLHTGETGSLNRFQSFSHPIAIFMATILCGSGALLALFLKPTALNISLFMGAIQCR